MNNFCLALAVLLVAGCAASDPDADPTARWIKGTLVCLDDSTSYEFRIEKKDASSGAASGGMVAIHPNGTRLAGRYTGLLATETSRTQGGWNRPSWETRRQSGTAEAQGVLQDSEGTLIQLKLRIQVGDEPHGLGEGKDNRGRTYQVQF